MISHWFIYHISGHYPCEVRGNQLTNVTSNVNGWLPVQDGAAWRSDTDGYMSNFVVICFPESSVCCLSVFEVSSTVSALGKGVFLSLTYVVSGSFVYSSGSLHVFSDLA